MAAFAAQPAKAIEPSVTAHGPLAIGFSDPPSSARPRVWWHWMNGNVTKDGIAKDLAWMKRVGIGGLQQLDVNLMTPQVVDERLVYMTPPWKEAFRFAAGAADNLGLELTIPASPGWSETGGPWVEPKDGMKKLVWSELTVAGGRRVSLELPAPPATSGPFHDFRPGDVLKVLNRERVFEPPTHYEDVAVFAYPARHADISAQPRISSNGKRLEIEPLVDDSLMTAVEVPPGTPEQPTIVTIEYDSEQTVRSAALFITDAPTLLSASAFQPRLEASVDDEAWRTVASFTLTGVPTTVSFEPVTARRWRVVLAPNPAAPQVDLEPVPGVDNSILRALLAPESTPRIALLRLSNTPRVDHFEIKAGFAVVDDFDALGAHVGRDVGGVDPGEVIDLTTRLQPDGSLDWTPPEGRWRIVRLGFSLTGKTNHPAPFEATGLEVDKYDGAAVRRYMEHYIRMYRDAAGPELIGERGVRAILTDSFEAGASNWTPGLLEHFRRLRGYDPRPFLPALTGTIVGSRKQSDAFLYDYRRTLADLIASEHYGVVAAVAHEHGLKVYGESLEGGRVTLGDDMEMRKYADYPMAAMWTYERNGRPSSAYLADMKAASSTAHLYGKPIVAAESLTSGLVPWGHSPADLRRIVDLEFAYGINRIVIHTSVHQPRDDKKPGLSLTVGQYFTRHEPWAEMAQPWVDYIARSSYLLQQGCNVADVAYFHGEDPPVVGTLFDGIASDLPTRYAYDFVNADALLTLLKVQDGALVTPGCARYRILQLGGTRKMTLPVLRRIAELAEAGATILGDAPQGSPGLSDDPKQYAALVRKLWSGQEATVVGQGRVIAGGNVEAVLESLGVAPDFSYDKPAADSEILFVHRKLDDADIYFVTNRRNRAERIEARFRVSGRVPTIWRTDTGAIEPVSYRVHGGETVVPLEMGAEDSFFVVFDEFSDALHATVPKQRYAPVMTLQGAWSVRFQPGLGAPDSVELPSLKSLSEHADPGVKYFSGVATYTKRFKLPQGIIPGERLVLDLGKIGDVAEVRVNGELVGTAWHAPYQLEIGKALRSGTNELEVRVANLWVNRLIGDAQPGARRVTFTALPTYRADAPLRPSGLIGPVRLLQIVSTSPHGS